MRIIPLKFEKKYNCNMFIGKGILKNIDSCLIPILSGKKAVIVTNPLVRELYGDKVAKLLANKGVLTYLIEIPDGEKSKSLSIAEIVYKQLLEFRADRSTVLIALGGGVVGDLGGFVASTFMRGIPLIHIPTTLLAQIDSSIGGKTAIDHPQAKNIIGSFYQPIASITDTEVLDSLPISHLKNGIAEAIKIAIISSPSLFSWIDDHMQNLLSKERNSLEFLVSQAVQLKVDIILKDPWEVSERHFLNLGHSIGHALEVTGDYDWITHGEAVAIGTVLETRIATSKKLCSLEESQKIDAIFRKLHILENIDLTKINPEKCWKAILLDKKNKNDNIRFVLPEKIGKVKLVQPILEEDVEVAFGSLQHIGEE
jgi:3-dehydroquinate synthase